MRKIFTVFLLFLLLIPSACGQQAQTAGSQEQTTTYQEQYDLGLKYLDDGKYEEAVIAFKAAIEIEPNHSEAYLGIADAYVGLSDYEEAEQILKDGYDVTSDQNLQEKLEEIQAEHPTSQDEQGADTVQEAQASTVAGLQQGTEELQQDESKAEESSVDQKKAPEQIAQEDPQKLFSQPLLAEEITLGGSPLWVCSLKSLSTAYPQGNMSGETSFFTDDFNFQTDIAPAFVSFSGKAEFRGLYIGMSRDEALKAVGLNDIGISFAKEGKSYNFDFYENACVRAALNQGELSSDSINFIYDDIPQYDYLIFVLDFKDGMLTYMESSVRNF